MRGERQMNKNSQRLEDGASGSPYVNRCGEYTIQLMDIQNIPFKCPHKLILLFLIFSTITIEKSQMHSSEFGGYTSSSRVF